MKYKFFILLNFFSLIVFCQNDIKNDLKKIIEEYESFEHYNKNDFPLGDFSESRFKKEYEFVQNISNPKKAGGWWDSLFTKITSENSSIDKKSSKMILKFRMISFLIANRLYYKKFKTIIRDKHDT